MEITIIVMMTLGFILIGVSLYLIKKEEKERESLNIKLDEAFSSINTALDSFEEQTNDFNNTCELIFREIEGKYQELLYIYDRIDEKQNEKLAEVSTENEKDIKNKKNKNSKQEKKKTDNSFIFKNKNAQEIFRLYDEGMSETDIAKTLSLGKGEVTLMLNIRKA